MIKLDFSGSHAATKIQWSLNSWMRGIVAFVALSSASFLNLCHATTPTTNVSAYATLLKCECTASAAPSAAPAATSNAAVDVVQIDEDWELVITEPDPNVAAPQIQTVMSPFQNLSGFYICFLVNHRNNPESAVGGLEVQFWYGDSQLGARRLDRPVLQESNEPITWTQRLMIKGNSSRYVCFRIVDGQSESWGSFGGSEPLHMNLDTSESNLSSYSSNFSIANSGVTFASNRVSRLVLKAVRGYDEDGDLMFEQTTPVVVYDGEVD